MDTTTNFLFFNSRDELLRLDISKIVYFESDGNYTNIILTNKLRGIICLNLAQTEKILEERLKEKADRKSTRLNSSHPSSSRMPSSA